MTPKISELKAKMIELNIKNFLFEPNNTEYTNYCEASAQQYWNGMSINHTVTGNTFTDCVKQIVTRAETIAALRFEKEELNPQPNISAMNMIGHIRTNNYEKIGDIL